MSKTLLVVSSMFTRTQKIMVLNENEVIETTTANYDNVADVVNQLAQKYSIQTVNVKGMKAFTKKLGDSITENAVSKYNNSLKINYIK